MNRPVVLVAGLFAVSAAFGLGVLVGRHSPAARAAAPVALPAGPPSAPLPSPAAAPVNRPPPPAAPAPVVDASRLTPLARLRIWSEINDKMRIKATTTLMMGGEMNPDIATLLGLSPDEAAALNQRLKALKQTAARVEAAHAVVQPQPDGKFAITIPAYPQEGGQLLDRAMRDLHEFLGDERFALLQTVTDPTNSFNGLGAYGVQEVAIDLAPAAGPTGRKNSMSSSSSDGTITRLRVETNTSYFKNEYPELYRRMVAEGTWPAEPPNP